MLALVLMPSSARATPWWEEKPILEASEAELAKARASATLEAYWKKNKSDAKKLRFVVRAAHELAQTEMKTRETWQQRTIDAFAAWRKLDSSALGTPEAELAAEIAYEQIDSKIRAEWTRLTYEGDGGAVLKAIEADAKRRDKLVAQLDAIATDYGSQTWKTIALARSGSVFDLQRTALMRARVELPNPPLRPSPALVMWAKHTLGDPKSSPEEQEAATRILYKEDQLKVSPEQAWNDRRKEYYDAIDPQMIDRYARSWIRGRPELLVHASLRHAIVRLAYWEAQLGTPNMSKLLIEAEKHHPPFKYKVDMFTQLRAGAFVHPNPVDLPIAPMP